ncbi:lipoate--protein ligase family protein [Opitutaceae bacterium TAV3]|nr:lipoate--protein ligase family protein [Opitutaceae bacterium TAV3]
MMVTAPPPPPPRFRHYGWHRPAFTFGYGQKIADVRTQLPAEAGDDFAPCEVIRRPSSGGIFDHRDDWAYALVIPRGHDLEAVGALESYRILHRALADALAAQGASVRLHDSPQKNEQCVPLPAPFDVIDARTGQKIATAAQKRTKHGLLFQGTISRPAAERAGGGGGGGG